MEYTTKRVVVAVDVGDRNPVEIVLAQKLLHVWIRSAIGEKLHVQRNLESSKGRDEGAQSLSHIPCAPS